MFFGRACQIFRTEIFGPREITYRCIGRVGVDEDIIERNIVSANEEVGPARRVELSDTLHADSGGVISQEQDWAVVGVGRVLELGQ